MDVRRLDTVAEITSGMGSIPRSIIGWGLAFLWPVERRTTVGPFALQSKYLALDVHYSSSYQKCFCSIIEHFSPIIHI